MTETQIKKHSVILSVAGSARSGVPANSRDLVLDSASNRAVREFSPIHEGTAAPSCPVERSSTAFSSGRQQPGFARPDSQWRLSPHNCRAAFLVLLAALLTPFAAAQTLTGTVKNATTGKPAAGDEVVLLTLGQGMEEAGRTKADAKGNFSFKLDAQGPHLVRAIHQGVTYHRMAPPGTTSVEVEVNDVAKQVVGIEVVADIMRVQAEGNQLDVMRAFAVENKSKPPLTQMNERNLEFYVPDGAKIVNGSAMTANGNPLSQMPVPQDDKKTRYSFLFPLRPGTTQFQVEYQLPYDGSANIDPKSIYPLQHFVAIVPKGMNFAAASGTNYQSMNDPQQPDANVQVASGAQAGQSLAFKVSGTGTLQARQENAGAPSEGGSAQGDNNRPGGGLGPPIDAPDPLQKYRWWILGAFALALVVGGVYVASRQQAAAREAARPKSKKALQKMQEPDLDADYEEPEAPPVREVRAREVRASEPRPSDGRTAEARPQPARPQGSSTSMLLEGLKEELFELEVEHKQGRISQQEYEKTKSALDQTLERALKREAAKPV
ncbi:MAG TPA: carboxypeptidase-like regulatory domain-containing protein [Candidatus Sulfotelmatobacter sp.]|nr:carboxypeptidase-like regulatory domain-containing protein [Candidatus Sulfotelmatobacter sp.]